MRLKSFPTVIKKQASENLSVGFTETVRQELDNATLNTLLTVEKPETNLIGKISAERAYVRRLRQLQALRLLYLYNKTYPQQPLVLEDGTTINVAEILQNLHPSLYVNIEALLEGEEDASAVAGGINWPKVYISWANKVGAITATAEAAQQQRGIQEQARLYRMAAKITAAEKLQSNQQAYLGSAQFDKEQQVIFENFVENEAALILALQNGMTLQGQNQLVTYERSSLALEMLQAMFLGKGR